MWVQNTRVWAAALFSAHIASLQAGCSHIFQDALSVAAVALTVRLALHNPCARAKKRVTKVLHSREMKLL
jgi:hypothetical protein